MNVIPGFWDNHVRTKMLAFEPLHPELYAAH